MQFNLHGRMTRDRKEEFANWLKEMSYHIGFKVSSRGWCYILENERVINKDQFDRVESAINSCRKEGLLPVDFVASDNSRIFKNLMNYTDMLPYEYLADQFDDIFHCHRWFKVDFWETQDCYVQVIVEKVDLVTLFEEVCRRYHIPIANAKGWSSILQRAEYARRFKEAEERGLQCVLLYCGDHDPAGLSISDFLRKNLEDVQDINWEDGEEGYDPRNLQIERFGLNYSFIQENGFTWIDNLITGSGKDLSDPRHRDHQRPYVQNYIKEYGIRKCEANVLVTNPTSARGLIQDKIIDILGSDALDKFRAKEDEAKSQMLEIREYFELDETVKDIMGKIKEYGELHYGS